MARALILMVAFVAMVAFSIVLAQVTLTPSPASADLIHANLTPGSSLRSYAEDYTFLAALKQAGGNLLLGFPFGLLLPVLVARRMRLLRVVGLTAVVMVLVELAQGSVVEGRAFDIDDVILNTSGALLAYLLLGRRIGRRYHRLADTPEDRAAARPAPAKPEKAKPAPVKPARVPDKKPSAAGAGRLAGLRERFRRGGGDRTGTGGERAGSAPPS
ncbi:VanZ family protein [Streptomyces koyangensis]|uniref:VanZ family protein n=1 Tax=Streptomyces koyangensis TaxID=188770 RepID=UPI003BF614AB